MTYEALFIDWDGTLCNSRLWEHWKDDPKYADHYEFIQDHLFRGADNTFQQWMLGEFTTEQALGLVAPKVGLRAEVLQEHMQRSCENMSFIDERLPNLLQRARERGLHMAIATDNMDCFARWTTPALGLHSMTDGILSSHQLGAFKRDTAPDGSSKFFSDYLRAYDIRPDRAVLIDDGPKNQIVESFGMNYLGVTPDRSAADILRDLLLK
jgi:FMN phosphatase YigB (HAD superfamily)